MGQILEVGLARKATRKRTRTRSSTGKAIRRKAKTRTARKKTAARATASRKRRATAAPKEPSRLASTATAARGVLAGALTAVTSRLPGGASEPDALQILEQEHRRFEKLLAQGEATTDRARKARRQLLETLASSLTVHELMEEKVLYPALESHSETRAVVLEG